MNERKRKKENRLCPWNVLLGPWIQINVPSYTHATIHLIRGNDGDTIKGMSTQRSLRTTTKKMEKKLKTKSTKNYWRKQSIFSHKPNYTCTRAPWAKLRFYLKVFCKHIISLEMISNSRFLWPKSVAQVDKSMHSKFVSWTIGDSMEIVLKSSAE